MNVRAFCKEIGEPPFYTQFDNLQLDKQALIRMLFRLIRETRALEPCVVLLVMDADFSEDPDAWCVSSHGEAMTAGVLQAFLESLPNNPETEAPIEESQLVSEFIADHRGNLMVELQRYRCPRCRYGWYHLAAVLNSSSPEPPEASRLCAACAAEGKRSRYATAAAASQGSCRER